MHGLIFISFRDYLAAVHGGASEQAATDGETRFLLSEAYPDEQFNALVDRACRATGLEHDVLLYDFGVFAVKTTFAGLYPALFAVSPSARAFLLTVETPIHELVRRVMPQSLPPKLVVSELGDQGVSIVYRSPRRLCVLLRGLVEGTAQHYGETAEITERSCMLRGARTCTVEVRFQHA
jgi:hypothetical protein